MPLVWLRSDLGSCFLQTTIHQPSSRLYQMLDRLLLLSEGHVFFYGESKLCSAVKLLQHCPLPGTPNLFMYIILL